MPGKIPWEVIGPAGGLVIILLVIVFGFILKMQSKRISTPAVPKDINTMSKKSPCFRHERDIGANSKAIELFGEQLEKVEKKNSEQHGKLFDKFDELKTDIITEIQKVNDK